MAAATHSGVNPLESCASNIAVLQSGRLRSASTSTTFCTTINGAMQGSVLENRISHIERSNVIK